MGQISAEHRIVTNNSWGYSRGNSEPVDIVFARVSENGQCRMSRQVCYYKIGVRGLTRI